MFWEWSLLTILSILSVFLFVKMYYFKSITSKEKRGNDLMKLTLKEAEILIRKYQIQLQRALGNVDILSEELTKLSPAVETKVPAVYSDIVGVGLVSPLQYSSEP